MLLDWIDSFSDRDALIEAVSPARGVVWHFQNAKIGKCGSVEFRCPPGSNNAKKTIPWCAFGMAFIQNAITRGLAANARSQKRLVSNVELRTAVLNGANRLSIAGDLGSLMENQPETDLQQLSEEEQLRIRDLKEKKRAFFAEQVCYAAFLKNKRTNINICFTVTEKVRLIGSQWAFLGYSFDTC